ncbi:MAG: 4Fe-4S double cluster binding domain-containing protein [Thermodesulfobacteriota bacterium]
MNTNSLTMQLKKHALSHGVDLIGITSAKPFIKRDRTETIIDPKELLDDARSVIVTAFYMNEVLDVSLIDKDNPRGRFTHAYSIRAYTPMGNLYIEIIKGFLKKQGYKTVFNKNYRIPDKMAAARGGVGKYGKNSVIITKVYGSYVMFVTLITNAPLEHEEYDLNASDCDKCEVCIRSCPTGAIYEPYKVNRSLCITEWLWGTFIPIPLREKQENRIFGCGECVKACPRNKKLISREEYPVKIEDVSTSPELIPLVTGNEEYYRKTIASFFMRAGMDAIRGNAIIALGNIGTDRAIDPLCITLTHPKLQIRAYSAWSLGKIGGAKVERALENALKSEVNPKVREEIRYALGER